MHTIVEFSRTNLKSMFNIVMMYLIHHHHLLNTYGNQRIYLKINPYSFMNKICTHIPLLPMETSNFTIIKYLLLGLLVKEKEEKGAFHHFLYRIETIVVVQYILDLDLTEGMNHFPMKENRLVDHRVLIVLAIYKRHFHGIAI